MKQHLSRLGVVLICSSGSQVREGLRKIEFGSEVDANCDLNYIYHESLVFKNVNIASII